MRLMRTPYTLRRKTVRSGTGGVPPRLPLGPLHKLCVALLVHDLCHEAVTGRCHVCGCDHVQWLGFVRLGLQNLFGGPG